MADTSGHHIIYGTLKDYLTGEELPDTDDERYRQQLARQLVEEKGYGLNELEPRQFIETVFSGRKIRSLIELTVRIQGRRHLVIRYGPGSLVTRERPALAAARILDPEYRIPLAVVTNLRDAELLETGSGSVLETGMSALPDRDRLLDMVSRYGFEPFVNPVKREQEARILNLFDEEICCRGGECELPVGSAGDR